jgi:Spy/CpxP family protein refolding chaperone
MNAWKAIISASVAILFVGGPAAFAQMPDALTGASPYSSEGHGDSKFAGRIEQWSDEIGLTAQQRSDLQIIVADYAERFRDLAKLGRDTATELLKMAPDDPDYFRLSQEASALAASSAAEFVTLLAEMRAKLYSTLTPEQRQKIEELIRSHAEDKAGQVGAE